MLAFTEPAFERSIFEALSFLSYLFTLEKATFVSSLKNTGFPLVVRPVKTVIFRNVTKSMSLLPYSCTSADTSIGASKTI